MRTTGQLHRQARASIQEVRISLKIYIPLNIPIIVILKNLPWPPTCTPPTEPSVQSLIGTPFVCSCTSRRNSERDRAGFYPILD